MPATVQRADPVGEARAGPSPRSGSAPPTPSSRDLDLGVAVAARDGHRGCVGVGVLGDVGQRLGDHEVGGRLDRLRAAARRGTSTTSTGSGERTASASTAACRPRSDSTAGWMPRASSRSSSSARGQLVRAAPSSSSRRPLGRSWILPGRSAASATARRGAAGRRRAGCAPAAGARPGRPPRSGRASAAGPPAARAARPPAARSRSRAPRRRRPSSTSSGLSRQAASWTIAPTRCALALDHRWPRAPEPAAGSSTGGRCASTKRSGSREPVGQAQRAGRPARRRACRAATRARRRGARPARRPRRRATSGCAAGRPGTRTAARRRRASRGCRPRRRPGPSCRRPGWRRER